MANTETGTILVVEDEMLIAMMLEDMLAALGHAIIGPIARVDEALSVAGHDTPDAALLDINLDGDEVYPVAEVLARRNVPFAFVTGYGDGGVNEQWRQRPRLEKPFQKAALERLVNGLLHPV